MPYKGTQQPDLVGLALNIMQMKRDREMNERKLALEEFKAQQMAQQNAIQAQRDEIKWQLDVQKSAMDLDEKMAGREKALAPTMNAANDARLAPAERQTAANQFVRGINQQIAAGRDPEMVGGNVGAEAATMRANEIANPKLDWEYRENGDKRRGVVGPGGVITPVPGAVWVPPKAGVTVNVGAGEGLDLKQIADVSDRESGRFQEKIAPYEALDNARRGLESFRGMADKDGMLPYEASQFVASDVMATMRQEALNEGDVKRLASVGLMNAAKEWVGIPARMSVAQADTLAQIINERARAKESKRRGLIRNGIYRAEKFGIDPKLIVGDYADEVESWKEEKPSGESKTPNGSGRLPPMTASDKVRLEKMIRKEMRLPASSEVPAPMIINAWKAEHGQGMVVE